MLQKIFVISAAMIASMCTILQAPAKDGSCKNEACRAYHHPRPRALKPLPCIPINFDQWHPDSVVASITYAGGRKWTDPKPVHTTRGRFCYGAFRYRNAVEIQLCNTDNKAVLSEADIGAGLNRAPPGWILCLKGSAWCNSHTPEGALRGAAP
ncbi:hypothetical protein FJY93_01180 [Candidatus Kaiserbacteria bacterium]|nr:hypothetical protein [Candidatus Kaiserbacteria bacterium]